MRGSVLTKLPLLTDIAAPEKRSAKRFLWSLFVIALVIRGLFLFWNPAERDISLYEHGDIAHNLYTGHGFTMHWPYHPIDSVRQVVRSQPPAHEGAFLPPVNPYILTGFYLGFGENDTALLLYRIFMCIISALVPVSIYMLTRAFASEHIARLAGVIAAINVFAAFSVATYSGSSLYQLLAVISLYTLLVAYKQKRLWYYVLIGVLTGLLTLLRSEYFLLGPFLILVSALLFPEKKTVRMQYILVALTAHTVCVAPWVYRNLQLFDAFVPVLSHPWYEIWRGNNPRANGTTKNDLGRTIWVDSVYDEHIVRAMDSLPYNARFEVAADSIFKKEVLAYWKGDPVHALGLAVKKVAMFATTDYNSSRFVIDLAYGSFSFVVFLMSIIGIIHSLREKVNRHVRAAGVLFGLFFLYYIALTFFTVMLPRYQIYTLNTMLPMAALGISIVKNRWRPGVRTYA